MSAAITGATFPLEFYEDINGERVKITFRASPLADIDLVELDIWVQSRYIRTARIAARDLPQEERDREIDIAQQRASTMSAFSGQGARMIATIDGMSQVVLQSVRRNHPDITAERLRYLLTNPANLAEANDIFHRANAGQAVKKTAGAKSKKARR